MSLVNMVDAHCHLSDARIYNASDEMIECAVAIGVSRIALGGVEPDEWQRQIILKEKYFDLILTHFGIHPWVIDSNFQNLDLLNSFFTKLTILASQANGIGETGLDFWKKRNPEGFAIQEEFFRRHIQLAVQLKKPLVLHIVSSHEGALKILKEEGGDKVPQILHRYSGNREQMESFLETGAYVSFSGEIGAEKGHARVKEAFQHVPLDRLLIETDAPDRGREPAEVNNFYQIAAQLRGVDSDELKQRVAENFSKIY